MFSFVRISRYYAVLFTKLHSISQSDQQDNCSFSQSWQDCLWKFLQDTEVVGKPGHYYFIITNVSKVCKIHVKFYPMKDSKRYVHTYGHIYGETIGMMQINWQQQGVILDCSHVY